MDRRTLIRAFAGGLVTARSVAKALVLTIPQSLLLRADEVTQ